MITFLLTVCAAITGWQTQLDYVKTVRSITPDFQDSTGNISLLDMLFIFPIARPLFLVLAVGIVGVLSYLLWSMPAERRTHEFFDLEYSMFVILMPLLSPISWCHFLVVLLLPIAIAGKKALNDSTDWYTIWGAFTVLVMISAPGMAFAFLFPLVRDHFSYRVYWLLKSLPTFGMLGLWLWMVQRYIQGLSARGTLGSAEWVRILIVLISLIEIAPSSGTSPKIVPNKK